MTPRPLRSVPRVDEPAPEPVPEPRVVNQPLTTESPVKPISREPHKPKVSPFVVGNPLDSANKGLFLHTLGLAMDSARRPRHE